MLSAFRPIATGERTLLDVSKVPILLQKSPQKRCRMKMGNDRIGASGFLKSMVVSRVFRTFGLAERHPVLAQACDGTSHLLVLQQLDVQVSLRRPRGAGDVPQPGRGEVQGRLTIRECAHHGAKSFATISAKIGLMRRSKQQLYLMTSSARPTRAASPQTCRRSAADISQRKAPPYARGRLLGASFPMGRKTTAAV